MDNATADAAPATDWWAAARSTLAQVGKDSFYLFFTFPISVTSFTIMVTGLSLAAGMLITVVGIPIGIATLYLAMGFGWLERLRLQGAGAVLPPIEYAPAHGSGIKRALSPLTDPRRWAAVVHATTSMVLSIFTWTVLITWWSGVLTGWTYWFWYRWLPEDGRGLSDLLNLPISDPPLYFLIGLAFTATLPTVLRGCVRLHEGWARLLLSGSSRGALETQVADLEARRTAAAAAETQALRQLERDLHDGPQQRLVRLGMELSEAERKLAEDPGAAKELLSAARQQTAETLAELRALSRGIAPPILTDRGLAAALQAITARSSVPTSVAVDLDARPEPAIESAAYFVVCEALVNVAKHSEASAAAVRVWRAEGLHIEVHDNGTGGADPAKGHGLAGLIDRVRGLGGSLVIASPAGGPTLLHATLPWA